MKTACLHCKRRFKPDKFHRNQKYCDRNECQKARKASWQKEKMKKDPSYRENQMDACRNWRNKNPSYYRDYRKKNKDYTERNRKRSRDQYQKHFKLSNSNDCPESKNDFAKMDLAPSQLPVKSGRYKLVPLGDPDFAKMDAAIVQIVVIQGVTNNEEFLQI